ncbi:hypothetical protein GCM10020367_07430 [Streptomyces sannanensis]|uniref:Uncharacterized protein n=1 Tax=Streptomyces sannanensis TaxID=285536 RepID=A0ABP6S5K0_9ACTN
MLRSGEADLETLDLAAPALAFGFRDSVEQVVADLHDPVALSRVRPQETASEATVLMDATGPVGSAAVAQGDPAAFEVTEELACGSLPALAAGPGPAGPGAPR